MHNEADTLSRYEAAIEMWTNKCISNPSVWHKPDTEEFKSLLPEITTLAQNGNVMCMYALATIHSNGLMCQTENEFFNNHTELISKASLWWEKAAERGYLPAVDNLLVCGVGATADRARKIAGEVESQRKDLIGSANGMPLYGESFIQEVFNRLYA